MLAFQKGSSCDGLPIVLSGRIHVLLIHPSGRERLWYSVRAGDLCLASASSLFDRGPLRATAETVEPTELVVLPQAEFDRLLGQSESFRAAVLSTFSRRMAHDLRELYDETFLTAQERLAAWLRRAEPVVCVTHADLAVRLGMSREAVSRALAQLAKSGAVRLGRERIEVIDLDKLTS